MNRRSFFTKLAGVIVAPFAAKPLKLKSGWDLGAHCTPLSRASITPLNLEVMFDSMYKLKMERLSNPAYSPDTIEFFVKDGKPVKMFQDDFLETFSPDRT